MARCKYCRGTAYTKEPFEVTTHMGAKHEVVFNFCPVCGSDLRQRKDGPWKIWFKLYLSGTFVGSGVYHRVYAHKSSATRRARKMYDVDRGHIKYIWFVSKVNPWEEEA